MVNFIPYGKQLIDQDDIDEVIDILKSDWMTQGPKIKEFETALCEITGAKYAVAVSSGTAALHLAVKAAGIKKNDEVITSPNTFVATSNAVLYSEGTVKFVDIDQDTGNMNETLIEPLISDNTKAIIPVHFAGQSCNMKEISSLAKRNNIKVIEDASHALGGTYDGAPIGSCKYSDMATFSFHPVKPIATGEGGAITTNNKELYELLIMLRTHGITKDQEKMSQNEGPWYYEMKELGFNYRMTDLQAALGCSQLKKLTYFTERRHEIATQYTNQFEGVERISPLQLKSGTSGHHLYVIKGDFQALGKSREDCMGELKASGIGTQVHYIPVYRQPYYQKLGVHTRYPNCESYYSKAISIPLFPKMTDDDVAHVIKTVRHIFSS